MKLALFFTESVSLAAWKSAGILHRELALYKALQTRGVDVEFITYGGSAERLFADELGDIRIRSNIFGFPLRMYQKSLVLFPPARGIFKSNQVSGAQVALRCAGRNRSICVVRCGYLLSEFETHRFGTNSPQAKKANILEKHVFWGADKVVITTEQMRESITSKYQLNTEKLHIIPNYVDVDRFRPRERQTNKRFRIVFVGRLDHQKNLLNLIDAVAPLDVELFLVGGGHQISLLAQRTEDAFADVVFKGVRPHEDLPSLLNRCDLFILPSLYEGHPKALIEAMACGLPVIGTKVRGIKEIIENGSNGLLCDTDAESIRSAIRQLMDNAALRKRLGVEARRYVVKNFSLDRVVDLEFSLLQELSS